MAALRMFLAFCVGAACGLGVAELAEIIARSMVPGEPGPVKVLTAFVAIPTLGFLFAGLFGRPRNDNGDRPETPKP